MDTAPHVGTSSVVMVPQNLNDNNHSLLSWHHWPHSPLTIISDHHGQQSVRVHIKPFHLISEYSDSCLLTVTIISLERSIPSCVSIFKVSLNTDVDILSQQP